MSLIVDKDNIFFILPEDRYSISSRTDGMMDKDFTLYAKFKINQYNYITNYIAQSGSNRK